MISDGAAGTDSGDGLAQVINRKCSHEIIPDRTKGVIEAQNQYGASDAKAFYIAARLYNSGSLDSSGLLERGIATHCYASDIANRLVGWVNAGHSCPY